MKIRCIIDNQAKFQSNFYAEHGSSLLFENGKEKVILDTGKTPTVFKHNLDLMCKGPVDKVVLSHGHNDHTGGIPVLFETATEFFMHPNAIIPKYAIRSDETSYIGFPKSVVPENMKMDFVTETTKIGNNLWIFNQVDDHTGFETIPQYLAIKKNNKFLNDKFSDEINLVLKTDYGLVVLSGCAHLGLVNILYSAMEYFQDEIYGVVGGSHLVQATPQRIEKTLDEFKKINPEIIALGHCTGFRALCKFSKIFKDKFIPLESGAEIMAL
jgi:7,8-dihydropterin-6-yl-methyl-4-(beta-D-ribofuranosyl)aminobenzene 5'-phosphate synthase